MIEAAETAAASSSGVDAFVQRWRRRFWVVAVHAEWSILLLPVQDGCRSRRQPIVAKGKKNKKEKKYKKKKRKKKNEKKKRMEEKRREEEEKKKKKEREIYKRLKKKVKKSFLNFYIIY